MGHGSYRILAVILAGHYKTILVDLNRVSYSNQSPTHFARKTSANAKTIKLKKTDRDRTSLWLPNLEFKVPSDRTSPILVIKRSDVAAAAGPSISSSQRSDAVDTVSKLAISGTHRSDVNRTCNLRHQAHKQFRVTSDMTYYYFNPNN